MLEAHVWRPKPENGEPGISPEFWRFEASDGYPIHVTSWPAQGESRGTVVVLHGVQSHGGWYYRLSRNLAAEGFRVHVPDRRGSGANEQDRGHAPSSRRLVRDLGEFLQAVRHQAPDQPITLAGISWGGKLALLGAGRYPEQVNALALICPGLRPRLGVPLLQRLRIALALIRRSRRLFPIPLSDPALFTANETAQTFIANDPLSLRSATAGLLGASFFMDRAVRWIPPEVTQPSLLMLSEQDRIVDNARTLRYFEQLASRDRRVIEYPDAHHTLEFEPDPDRYARDLIAWIHDVTIPPTQVEPAPARGS